MSDFDKEAEREKLREQFERDRQKRQQSERMSELLLKGATMTNKHHDCGSPIFRWQGEEFCPSCEGPNGSGGTEADARETGTGTAPEPEPGEATDTTADAAVDPSDPPADATDAAGGSADDTSGGVAADSTGVDVATESGTDDGATADPTARSDRRPAGSTPDAGSTRTAAGTAGGVTAPGDSGSVPGEGVAAALASLERTLADVARQAEETPTADLARKRNLVAAARETAEALEATRRADRQ